VLNKVDLMHGEHFNADVKISAKTGLGMNELYQLLKEKAIGSSNYSEKTAIVSNLRHFEALKLAKKQLETALVSINEKLSGEFIAVDLRNAENSLSEIIGKVTNDDILNNIFSKFCIGK
jgi:tRNA modification GTPase